MIKDATHAMSFRDTEDALLTRCAEAARDDESMAANQLGANVFRLAAMVIQSHFPRESKRLMDASGHYFVIHPDEQVPAAEVVRQRWIVNLPRLRARLSRKLGVLVDSDQCLNAR